MFERFTDRARKVMALANQEAQRANNPDLRTEHILLGLLKEGSGVGANVLKNLDVHLRKARSEVEELVKPMAGPKTEGRPIKSPMAEQVIATAIEEARGLNHNYVGTEHLLLGLLRVKDGVAAGVLVNLGLSLDRVRKEILELLGQGEAPGPGPMAGPVAFGRRIPGSPLGDSFWALSSPEAVERIGWLLLHELGGRAQKATASGDDVLAEEYRNIDSAMKALLDRLARLPPDA